LSQPPETEFFQKTRLLTIGVPLPAGAHRYRKWWPNQRDTGNRPQTPAWIQAGWKVATANQDEKWVRFRRN